MAGEASKSTDLRLAHWNIRSLQGKKKDEYNVGKMDSLVKYMDDNSIDILGLSETHMLPSSPDIHIRSSNIPRRSPRYILFASNLPAVAPPRGTRKTDQLIHNMKNRRPGVGIVISERFRGRMETVPSPDPSRILGLIITFDQRKVLVIEAYSPTDKINSYKDADMKRLRKCKEETKSKFYSDLQTMIDANRKTVSEVLLMGDFNARTGWSSAWSSVIGEHAKVEDPQRKTPLPSDPSDNGLRLLNFCQRNDLVIINNTFQRQNRDKWTWRSPKKTTSRIDFIIKTDAQSELTVEAFDIHAQLNIGAAQSDHRLIKARLRRRRRSSSTEADVTGILGQFRSLSLRDGGAAGGAASLTFTDVAYRPRCEFESYQRTCMLPHEDDVDMPMSDDDGD